MDNFLYHCTCLIIKMNLFMDVQKLQSKCPLLISYFKDNGYSGSYIRLFKTVIRSILKEANKGTLTSYEKMYELSVNRGYSPSVLKQRRSMIGIIKQFVQGVWFLYDVIFPFLISYSRISPICHLFH